MASLQCRRPLPRKVITVHISYFLRLGHEEAFGQSAGPLSEAGGRKGGRMEKATAEIKKWEIALKSCSLNQP